MGADFELEELNGLTVAVLPELLRAPGLVHGFTTRKGGKSLPPFDSLNLSTKVSTNPEDLRAVEDNRSSLAQAVGYPEEQWVKADQVHGNKVVLVKRGTNNVGPADALITQEKGLLLTISIADCLPIIIYDPVHKALGQVHAGWRGTLAKIVKETLFAMQENFDTDFPECLVGLGPCIGRCCYKVGTEVVSLFKKNFYYGEHVFLDPGFDTPRLDLALANIYQLRDMLVKEENIFYTGLCTCCRKDLFFSHRRDQGKTGRMLSYAGLL